MVPDLDLLLLASLYATFISAVLIVVVLLVLAGLALAFAAGLLLIVAADFYGGLLLLSSRFDAAKAEVELGLLLLLCTVLRCGVSASSAPKPWVERRFRAATEAVRAARNHYS